MYCSYVIPQEALKTLNSTKAVDKVGIGLPSSNNGLKICKLDLSKARGHETLEYSLIFPK